MTEEIALDDGTVVQRNVLQNGLRLITQHRNDGCLTIYSGICVGSNYERNGDSGLAHYIEHMLFRGTDNLSNIKVLDAIEGVGGRWNAETNPDYTSYTIRISKDHADLALRVLYDILFNSDFGPRKFEIERKAVLNEIRENADSIENSLERLFFKTLFKEHPMKMPVEGTIEIVSDLERDYVFNRYKEFYVPNNVVLCIIGDIDEETYNGIASRFEKSEKKKIPGLESVIEPCISKRRVAVDDGWVDEGSYVTVGWQLRNGKKILGINDPDMDVIDLIDSLLVSSEERMTGRLFQEVREKRGLVYSISSEYDALDDYSYFSVDFNSVKNDTDAIIDIILKEIKRIQTESVSVEELEKVKAYLISGHYLDNEGDEDRAKSLLTSEMFEKGVESFRDYRKKIQRISQEDVMRVANKYIDVDKCAIARIE
ncbi:insulinase family protein [Candidatus Woesearchaeota archaeon]|nr:insulinase family protein [Candidatus Woesearchaeota archaeon]